MKKDIQKPAKVRGRKKEDNREKQRKTLFFSLAFGLI